MEGNIYPLAQARMALAQANDATSQLGLRVAELESQAGAQEV